eukprot:TRINITY_DN9225_c0_g3_i1.p4 TRINITY_DN9225_c0_g3~~TRINITY_DN9225_c0_g3_i1.p4  ORF type:complete len:220 (+),score=67.79 TRINITY_DN9225_c0_g3_i1:68-661(+)
MADAAGARPRGAAPAAGVAPAVPDLLGPRERVAVELARAEGGVLGVVPGVGGEVMRLVPGSPACAARIPLGARIAAVGGAEVAAGAGAAEVRALLRAAASPVVLTVEGGLGCGAGCSARHRGQRCQRCGAEWGSHRGHRCASGERGSFAGRTAAQHPGLLWLRLPREVWLYVAAAALVLCGVGAAAVLAARHVPTVG